MKKFIAILTTIAFLGIILGLWWGLIVIKTSPQSESQPVVFEILKGSSFSTVTDHLVEQGLITNKRVFNVYARVMGDAGRLRSGEYRLDKSMSMSSILKVITSGKSIEYSVMFQEGSNIYEMGQQLEKLGMGSARSFLQLAHDRNLIHQLLHADLASFEGYLFPETYYFTKYTTQRELLERMVNRFLVVYGQISSGSRRKMSRHQVVTLASLVEKETGVGEERPRIAGVFFNRLDRGMRLQSDPTILYGIMEMTGTMKINITRQDIAQYTPYNTYRVNGLPVGPISNPGRDSLMAVMNPESSSYLYFVSHNDGTHEFSETLEKHNRAVQKYQLDRRQREGKSWRDLQRKSR